MKSTLINQIYRISQHTNIVKYKRQWIRMIKDETVAIPFCAFSLLKRIVKFDLFPFHSVPIWLLFYLPVRHRIAKWWWILWEKYKRDKPKRWKHFAMIKQNAVSHHYLKSFFFSIFICRFNSFLSFLFSRFVSIHYYYHFSSNTNTMWNPDRLRVNRVKIFPILTPFLVNKVRNCLFIVRQILNQWFSTS